MKWLLFGDSITFENEPTKYKVSELMFQGKNIPFACNNELITIGRMKGNIKPGDKIYKISNKRLSDSAKITYSGKEFKKIKLKCKIIIKRNNPISVIVYPGKDYDNYKGISVKYESKVIPEDAINQPITSEKIISQFSKTNDTPFEFEKIDVELDEGLYISKLSQINALRRDILEKLEKVIIKRFERKEVKVKEKSFKDSPHSEPKISVLLSQLNPSFNYTNMENVDRVYVPLRCFRDSKNREVIKDITSKFNTYIYLPAVINLNYMNLLDAYITSFISKYDVKGFVFSSIGEFGFMKDSEKYRDFDFIGNYTLNVFNNYSVDELSNLGLSTITLSPELSKKDIQDISSASSNKELIVYGKLKVMTIKYCLLGQANRLLS